MTLAILSSRKVELVWRTVRVRRIRAMATRTSIAGEVSYKRRTNWTTGTGGGMDSVGADICGWKQGWDTGRLDVK